MLGCTTAGLLVISALAAPGDPWVPAATWSGQLDSPARVAVAGGEVLVADPQAGRVVRFDAAGTMLGSFAEPAGPVGVAVHADGRVFVSRRDDGQVGVFDANHQYVGLLGGGAFTFGGATDLAYDASSDRLYVVDSGGDRVVAFDSSEQLVLLFGTRGSLTGQFKYPSAIAVDAAGGRLFVADRDNHRVQVFSTAGLFLYRFGYRIKYLPGGDTEGWVVRPSALAFDSDTLYVADGVMSNVRAFTPLGAELGVVADYGWQPGELRTPGGFALDGGGNVYLANSSAGVVEVYSESRSDGPLGKGVVYRGTNGGHVDRWRSRVAGAVRSLRAAEPAQWLPGVKEALATPSTWDPPHMLPDTACNRCHDVDGQPGGHLGLAEGQANLCFSCHTVASSAPGQALRWVDAADPYGTNPLVADGQGRSHAWGVPVVSAEADSVGPTPGGAMANHLDGDNLKCGTCHEPHNSGAGAPFLRVSNLGDAMCKECHAPRNEGVGERGTHPVGFVYPGGTGEFPAAGGLDPLVVPMGLVQCTTCHGVHGTDSGGANAGAGDGLLLRKSHDVTLCTTCHTEHPVHTPANAWQPTCVECHDTHDPASDNLGLVARSVYNQTLGQPFDVVLLARTGPDSFAGGGPGTPDGICQVCHTATTYHRYDGSGIPHHEGADCTSCHPHSAGFMPTGGSCIDCHAVAQDNGDGVPVGGRRAVVGEFPTGSAHAHYGTELDNDACVVCHDLTTHTNGYVELLDADDGSLYSFVSPADLTSSPDLSDFCMSCHDADGAGRLAAPLNPFGNGNVPPNAAERFAGSLQWAEHYGDFCFGEGGTFRAVNSHHDISDADQAFSGAKIECLDCHGAHQSAGEQPVIDPYNPGSAWTGSGNDFCLACHAGGNGPGDPAFPAGVVSPAIALRGIDSCDYTGDPWFVDFAWMHTAHGPSSKRPWLGYSGAPEYELACQDCHDPHGSYSVTNPAGNPYAIRDFVDGTAYVDDGYRDGNHWTGPPWNTFGIAREVVVDVNGLDVGWGSSTGLCAVCHADWVGAGWFHPDCGACQNCHAHGALWGEHDWYDEDGDQPCQP